MRLTEFWARMTEHFGRIYADVVARDQVLGELGGRTALEALNDGEEPRAVWLAICGQLEIPVADRH